MRDAGKDVRRRSSAVAKLSDTVQGMMAAWTEDNFLYFQQTMDLIREGAPVQWAKLYMEAVKMGIIKESNINININRQQDHESLQALVRARLPLPESGSYTPYEEVKPSPAATVPSASAGVLAVATPGASTSGLSSIHADTPCQTKHEEL